jgi:hypothetical protein
MTLIPDALGSSMQEPSSPDNTSAPPEQIPAQQGPSIAKVLGQRKKKGFGPNIKNPGALAGAIARAKRARQSGQKWG